MSADLDRLLAWADDIGTGIPPSELRPALHRIAADYAQVVAERDRWRAIAERHAKQLTHLSVLALDADREARQ